MPVGPPCVTTSSGYFFEGEKSFGLTRTPSIAAPSLLVHDTTSRDPTTKGASWADMSVSFAGPAKSIPTRNTSAIDVGEPAVKATRLASFERVTPDPISESGVLARVIALLVTSSEKRCPVVFWRPWNQMRSPVHAIRFGSSSKLSDIEVTGPPVAATTAIREFAWKKSGRPIAD